ncbi:MAG: DUF190 domain-containing protein [Acidimicrobiales bacterium]
MKAMKTGTTVNIYLNLDEYVHNHLAYELVMRTLVELGFPGASVVRSIESFGSHHHIARAHLLSSEDDRGVIVHLIDDDNERIHALLLWLDHNLPGHLVTLTETKFRHSDPSET